MTLVALSTPHHMRGSSWEEAMITLVVNAPKAKNSISRPRPESGSNLTVRVARMRPHTPPESP